MEFTNRKDNACSLKEKLKGFDNQLSEDSTGYFTAVEKTVETYLLTQLSDKSERDQCHGIFLNRPPPDTGKDPDEVKTFSFLSQRGKGEKKSDKHKATQSCFGNLQR